MAISRIEIDPHNRTITTVFNKDSNVNPHTIRYTKVSVGGHLIAALVRLIENKLKIDRGIYDR